MTDPLNAWFVHPVSVERYEGTGAYGDTYTAATTVTGFVDDGARLVVGADGEEVTSSARVFLPVDTADVPIKSRVTLPADFDSRTAQVVAVARHTSGRGTPDHLELALR